MRVLIFSYSLLLSFLLSAPIYAMSEDSVGDSPPVLLEADGDDELPALEPDDDTDAVTPPAGYYRKMLSRINSCHTDVAAATRRLAVAEPDDPSIDWHEDAVDLMRQINRGFKGDARGARQQVFFHHLYKSMARSAIMAGLDKKLGLRIRKQNYRLFSLSGGGIRGVITTEVLKHIEEGVTERLVSKGQWHSDKPVKIRDLFHMGIGTSTGGIVTAACNLPLDLNAVDIQKFYLNHGSEIFQKPKYTWKSLWGGFGAASYLGKAFGPKYTAEGLETFLYSKVGRMRLSDCVIPSLFTAYNTGLRRTDFFKSYRARNAADREFYMIDVLRGTSAAPTYFNPVKIYDCARGTDEDFDARFVFRNGRLKRLEKPVHSAMSEYVRPYSLFDGGLNVNNPSMCGFVEAIKNYGPLMTNMTLVNIGTGDSETPIDYSTVDRAGPIGLMGKGKLIEMIMDQDHVDYQLDGISRVFPVEHYNFNITLDKSDMDCVDPEYLADLQGRTRAMLRSPRGKRQLDDLCDILAEPKSRFPAIS